MEPIVLRALLVGAALTLLAAAAMWCQRRDGVVKVATATRAMSRDELAAVDLDLSEVSRGALLLGSATCVPCDAVKRLLGRLEREHDDFRWVYADVAEHLALADAHRVMRVPTLFILEPSGRILARSSGVPAAEDLRRLLDDGHLDDDTVDPVAV